MADSGTEQNVSVVIDPSGVIVVRGDVDMAGGPLLEAMILQCEPRDPLVIDLGGVQFIDSSGLRSLLGASHRAAARDARVHLRHVGPEVLRLLEITATTDQFDIEVGNG